MEQFCAAQVHPLYKCRLRNSGNHLKKKRRSMSALIFSTALLGFVSQAAAQCTTKDNVKYVTKLNFSFFCPVHFYKEKATK